MIGGRSTVSRIGTAGFSGLSSYKAMEIAYDYGISAGMSGVTRNKRKDLIRGGKGRELVMYAYS